MHEHIIILGPETLTNFNHAWGEPWWDEETHVADAISKLQAVKDAGIDTLVDPTAIGLGRDIRRIQRLNAAVDLNIVVCTGIYAFLELPNFFKYRTPDAIAEFFVRELREGIDDTGVKPAFIKCAVEEHGIVGDLPTILAAVAIASNTTGAPVMVHTNATARTGLLALENLTGAGVDPERIVIAHVSDSQDLDYIRRIADSGAALGYDRFNIPHFNSDESRIETAIALLGDGLGDRIHFGHDAAAFYDFMTGNPFFANEKPDYLHIEKVILPAMRERGVTEEQIDQIMVASARRFFS
jgi:phosphotriesterase-related protein